MTNKRLKQELSNNAYQKLSRIIIYHIFRGSELKIALINFNFKTSLKAFWNCLEIGHSHLSKNLS
ncbi:hypothetical protein BpHYR1_048907 [Brachionus plicatilis]|uniref:Uncharacterized protein n=1 Tax=Brachionus plicatilis TaxID=10195 RepID=A0A3M7S1H9_BRAPC|nr:hypothetical protein BpHYR1_048907 [Brachionus plicatilis]